MANDRRTEEPDVQELDERLDELEEEIDETREQAEEHETLPGKKKPTFVDPNPEGPDGETGFPNMPAP